MASDVDIGQMARSFRALADPTRQRILLLLQDRERCVGELVEEFNVSQPAISRHLAVLKNAGLVADRRQGQLVYYSLDVKGLLACLTSCFGRFTCCAPLFENVKEGDAR